MMRMLASLTAMLLLARAAAAAGPTVPPGGALAGQRYRVLISSDIGGSDQDDDQSMVHFLLYSDLFDIEGLVSSPPGAGRAASILKVIDVYAKDYPRLKVHSARYPAPSVLRGLTKQGHTRTWKEGASGATEGSKWIIRQARRKDPRPLYVLVWGSITDVAQAVKDAPDIKKHIRVYFIASWNRRQDPDSLAYLDSHHPDLWLIESETTFRGWYVGGNQRGDLGNAAFVRQHAKGHGALGEYFAPLKGGKIKMGDTPSVAYLLRGDPADPAGPSWGGRYRPHADEGRKTWWVDLPRSKDLPDGARQTVWRWREQYLRDFQKRLDRCLPAAPATKGT